MRRVGYMVMERTGRGTMKAVVTTILALGILAGCARHDEILPGLRLDVRPAGEEEVAARSTALSLPAPAARAEWTHKAGNPAHAPGNPALALPLDLAWSVDIGDGASRRYRFVADPVIASGRVFAMDSRANVTALSLGGETLWTRDLTPSSDRGGASGGGLAVADGRLYVTTGFGELTALDAGTGAQIWRQDLKAAALGAPTVVGNTVYVVSRDSRGWALDSGTGRVRWESSGVPSQSGVAGGASPAVDSRAVYYPLNSGELVAIDREEGRRLWTSPVVGGRLGSAYSGIDDISGDPVLVGSVIYVGNPSGRTMALDAASGRPLWTARDGALSSPVVAGGSVFTMNDANELVRLDASTGAEIWRTQMPLYTAKRLSRRKGVYAHYGPVLAGSRLIVASSDGYLRTFDPVNGGLVGAIEMPDDAASNPIVANNMLFVMDSDGRLNAYR